ncbi:hypothetical protein DFH08DRAFT_1025215 [Mycena albidolilacea]|uniref:Uncharacterized protein n=1 Tax=Mycena albidolilacea TaxID=1033008 RepID=A0AAD7AME4_9AGAR|nr:hypothetical protein DFH08DRAFT_1025215 [Mycena albidolilacea]
MAHALQVSMMLCIASGSIGCQSLRIPEATANTCLPPEDLPVLKLIKFNLPPLHKSTAFLNPTDYLSEYAPTLTIFDPAAIPVPPHAVVKNLEHAILSDKDICSIVLVRSLQHRDEDQQYPLWLVTPWARMERACEARTLWRSAVDGIHEMLDASTKEKNRFQMRFFAIL